MHWHESKETLKRWKVRGWIKLQTFILFHISFPNLSKSKICKNPYLLATLRAQLPKLSRILMSILSSSNRRRTMFILSSFTAIWRADCPKLSWALMSTSECERMSSVITRWPSWAALWRAVLPHLSALFTLKKKALYNLLELSNHIVLQIKVGWYGIALRFKNKLKRSSGGNKPKNLYPVLTQ